MIYLEGLKTSESKKIVDLLEKEVLPDILAQIQNGAGLRQRELLVAIDGILQGSASPIATALAADMGSLALAEAEWQVSVLGKTLPIQADFVTPPQPLLRAIVQAKPFQGNVLRGHVENWNVAARSRMAKSLRIGLAQGESIPQITKRVKQVVNKSSREISAVVRTATNQISTEARQLTFKENSDMIKGVQIVATLDGRTTLICISLDGKIYPIDEGDRPPFHFNCRTTITPVVKSLEELGFTRSEKRALPTSTRASMNGEVSAKVTYPDWLRSQPKEFQDKVLGKERAALWRDNRITIDKMVTSQLKVRSVAELRALEGLPG